MTPNEAQGRFTDTMTNAEMRQAWRYLETGGCRIRRHKSAAYVAGNDLWTACISNPTWTEPHDPVKGVEVSYEQRDDGSWTRLE